MAECRIVLHLLNVRRAVFEKEVMRCERLQEKEYYIER